MRTLATGNYTHDQVAAQLRASTATVATRYELLDRDLNTAGDITSSVIDGQVTVNADRVIKGSLDLTLRPIEDLRGALFQYHIKPWHRIRMPDGGWAEHPLGVFVWVDPSRDVDGPATGGGVLEEWAVTLGDRGHHLDTTGPGPSGFRGLIDDQVTDVVAAALRRAGIVDTSGVQPSGETLSENLTWTMTRNTVRGRHTRRGGQLRAGVLLDSSTTPESMGGIADDLLDGIGYYTVWFDGDGVPQGTPARDLATTDPDITYDSSTDSVILSPSQSEHDPGNIANRVFVRSQNNVGTLQAGFADLDTVIPGHPLSQGVIGRYIDATVDDQIGGGQAGRDRRARRELYRRLSTYQTFTLETLPWPAHEAFDVVEVRIDGDPEFGDGAVFHERGWSLELPSERSSGRMTHDLSRVRRVTA